MLDILVLTQYSYYCEFFCLGPASHICDRHCRGWVRYIDTTKITVLRFVWDCSVFTQSIHYCDFFWFGPSLHLRNNHHHGWMHYTDTTNITVWCISLLLLSIHLWWFCYFIMFCFKLTNGAMMKWWMAKWCNDEIRIRIGRFVSHKYRIFSFIFLNTTFLHQIKQFITYNYWSLTTDTSTKCMLSNQATTETQGFIRGRLIFVREIITLI